MYLFIFEDGEVKKATTFCQEDMDSCDAGILDVIDLHVENPKQYYDGQWYEIKSADA
jgi:hypothetical protein